MGCNKKICFSLKLNFLKSTFATSFLSFLLLIPFFVFAQKGVVPILSISSSEFEGGNLNNQILPIDKGDLFVANNYGIIHFTGNEWKRYTSPINSKIRSLFFDEAKNVLFYGGQDDFGFFHADDGYTSLKAQLPNNQQDIGDTWAVFQLNGDTYFCAFKGIYKYNGNEVTLLESEALPNFSFLFDESLYIHFPDTGISVLSNDNFIHLPGSNVFRKAVPIGIIDHPDYQFVVGSQEGSFWAYNGVSFELIWEDITAQLGSQYINKTIRLSDGRIAIATQTKGLYIADPNTGTLINYGQDTGLVSNSVFNVFETNEGGLWVSQENGLSLISLSSPYELYNTGTGIEGAGYSVYQSQDGEYYSTSNGIYFSPKGEDEVRFVNNTEGPAYSFMEIGGRDYAFHHGGVFLLQSGQLTKQIYDKGSWLGIPLKNNPGKVVVGTYEGLLLCSIMGNELMVETILDVPKISFRFLEEDDSGSVWASNFSQGIYKIELDQGGKSIRELIHYKEKEGLPFVAQNIISKVNGRILAGTSAGIFYYDKSKDKFYRDLPMSSAISNSSVYLLKQGGKGTYVVTGEKAGVLVKEGNTFKLELNPSNHLRKT